MCNGKNSENQEHVLKISKRNSTENMGLEIEKNLFMLITNKRSSVTKFENSVKMLVNMVIV